MKGQKRPRLPRWLGVSIAITFLGGAALLLRHELRDYRLSDAVRELSGLPWWRLGGSVFATVLGYGALIGHDVIGLRHMRRSIALRRVALAAFIAYAFSNSAPMSFAVAGTLRLRFYSRWGLGPADISRLVGITIITYSLGLVTAAAAALTIGRFPLPRFLRLPIRNSFPLGVLALLLLIGYLVWTIIRARALETAQPNSPRPTFGFTASQIGISLADWGLSATALYVLITSKTPLQVETFFGVFILGQLVALIAQVPGGIGVFDAVVIWGLRSSVPAPVTLAALLCYRVIYYLMPLIVASGFLVATEGAGILKRRRG